MSYTEEYMHQTVKTIREISEDTVETNISNLLVKLFEHHDGTSDVIGMMGHSCTEWVYCPAPPGGKISK